MLITGSFETEGCGSVCTVAPKSNSQQPIHRTKPPIYASMGSHNMGEKSLDNGYKTSPNLPLLLKQIHSAEEGLTSSLPTLFSGILFRKL
jgi:hypothetical protein